MHGQSTPHLAEVRLWYFAEHQGAELLGEINNLSCCWPFFQI